MQLLREDYLEHRTLYEAVQSIIMDRAQLHPLRILDLGCGDSEYIARVLEAAGSASIVDSYTGVDLSEPALAISERNIARYGAPHLTSWMLLHAQCEEPRWPVHNMSGWGMPHLRTGTAWT